MAFDGFFGGVDGDQYGPANARASSGGETRVIRMAYGQDEIYTRMARDSLRSWQELFARIGQPDLGSRAWYFAAFAWFICSILAKAWAMSLFAVLVISNVVTALSTFYLAPEVRLLLAAPPGQARQRLRAGFLS